MVLLHPTAAARSLGRGACCRTSTSISARAAASSLSGSSGTCASSTACFRERRCRGARWRRRRAARRAQTEGRGQGLTLLDVGTGSGDIARALAGLGTPELRVTGLDRRPEMVAAARTRTAASERVAFVEGDMFALARQFGEGAFDLAHASLTLH
ncbi:MAG: methyltransferase domain-containing protein, partial [Phycisphaerales bacterium]